MKIGDVEYQGDKTKAIFYYLADDRVDFRQLIRVLADTFRIRIEMKQIGARQEAGPRARCGYGRTEQARWLIPLAASSIACSDDISTVPSARTVSSQ